MAAKIDVKVDVDKELKKATRALGVLNKLGGLGIFAVNAIFVGLLARMYYKWVDKSSSILEFVQISFIIMMALCIIGCFTVYYFASVGDEKIVPEEAIKGEKQADEMED